MQTSRVEGRASPNKSKQTNVDYVKDIDEPDVPQGNDKFRQCRGRERERQDTGVDIISFEPTTRMQRGIEFQNLEKK